MIARIALGVVFIVAAIPKLQAPTDTTMGLQAYELFGYDVAHFLALFVPLIELALGVALVLGAATRAASVATCALLVVYIGLIISAAARGLNIDCGCFSRGGTVAASATHYGRDIARDVGFIALGVLSYIGARRHPLSIDRLLPASER